MGKSRDLTFFYFATPFPALPWKNLVFSIDFFPVAGSVILRLLPLDMLGVISSPSEEILGPSERGDLIDSLLGCLLREALIDRGMHFDPTEFVSSLSTAKSNCLQLLHCHFICIFQYGREQEEIPYSSTMFGRKLVCHLEGKLYIRLKKVNMNASNYIVLVKGWINFLSPRSYCSTRNLTYFNFQILVNKNNSLQFLYKDHLEVYNKIPVRLRLIWPKIISF